MRSWLLAAATALALGGSAQAQELAGGACVASIVQPGVDCRVIGTAMLGESVAGPVIWALYELGSGENRAGLSVLKAANSLVSAPTPVAALDRWKRDPNVVASLIKRDGAEYVVVAFPGDDGPRAFAVHQVTASGLQPVDTLALQGAVPAKLAAVTRPDCYVVSSDMNWRAFALRYDMMNDDGSCGTAHLDLGVEAGAVKITSALAVRDEDVAAKPKRRARARRR